MIGVFGDVRRRRSLKGSVDISKGMESEEYFLKV